MEKAQSVQGLQITHNEENKLSENEAGHLAEQARRALDAQNARANIAVCNEVDDAADVILHGTRARFVNLAQEQLELAQIRELCITAVVDQHAKQHVDEKERAQEHDIAAQTVTAFDGELPSAKLTTPNAHTASVTSREILTITSRR